MQSKTGTIPHNIIFLNFHDDTSSIRCITSLIPTLAGYGYHAWLADGIPAGKAFTTEFMEELRKHRRKILQEVGIKLNEDGSIAHSPEDYVKNIVEAFGLVRKGKLEMELWDRLTIMPGDVLVYSMQIKAVENGMTLRGLDIEEMCEITTEISTDLLSKRDDIFASTMANQTEPSIAFIGASHYTGVQKLMKEREKQMDYAFLLPYTAHSVIAVSLMHMQISLGVHGPSGFYSDLYHLVADRQTDSYSDLYSEKLKWLEEKLEGLKQHLSEDIKWHCKEMLCESMIVGQTLSFDIGVPEEKKLFLNILQKLCRPADQVTLPNGEVIQLDSSMPDALKKTLKRLELISFPLSITCSDQYRYLLSKLSSLEATELSYEACQGGLRIKIIVPEKEKSKLAEVMDELWQIQIRATNGEGPLALEVKRIVTKIEEACRQDESYAMLQQLLKEEVDKANKVAKANMVETRQGDERSKACMELPEVSRGHGPWSEKEAGLLLQKGKSGKFEESKGSPRSYR